MGIKGLHKALSFCTIKDSLENYSGKRLAIDTSSWYVPWRMDRRNGKTQVKQMNESRTRRFLTKDTFHLLIDIGQVA